MSKWFSASRILGYTMLIGAVNIVLITALSTVGAMVYNLVTHMGGGIEVTLRETD
jgi:Flp pilus assembly pilin Flp